MTPSAPSSFSKTRVVSMSGRVLMTVTCTPRTVRWSVIKRSFAALTASLHQPMVALLALLSRRARRRSATRATYSPAPSPVSHSRVEQVHGAEEDRVEHILEELPRDDQPKQAERPVAPHEHLVLPGGVVAQEDGNSAAAVEWRERKQIEGGEQQVE